MNEWMSIWDVNCFWCCPNNWFHFVWMLGKVIFIIKPYVSTTYFFYNSTVSNSHITYANLVFYRNFRPVVRYSAKVSYVIFKNMRYKLVFSQKNIYNYCQVLNFFSNWVFKYLVLYSLKLLSDLISFLTG